jgi:hypothetical protein
MTIYLSEKEAKKAGLVKDTRKKRGRNTRPDIPAAGRAKGIGLTTLIAPDKESNQPAWSTEYCVGRGYRLYVINDPSKDTGYHLDLTAACAAAREGNKP